MRKKRQLLKICDFPATTLRAVVDRGLELKKGSGEGDPGPVLAGKVLALLFTKPSTRTRVSFEAGAAQLGGSSIYLDPATMQLSRGESLADTARVLSSMADAIVARIASHDDLATIAEHSSAPVINALTDLEHPCQVLADLMTFAEERGDIKGKRIAWIGDCNNVCRSWMQAAASLGFQLAVAAPPAYRSNPAGYDGLAGVSFADSPAQAAAQADCVVTDVWYSMGDEKMQEKRKRDFAGYTVDADLMAQAAPDALFMHCLPAHRGEEVAAEVIDGPQSVVWTEAENRLHVQKALLELLLA